MNKGQSDEYIDQLLFMVTNCSNRERKFVLHMVEQLIKGQESYLKD